MPETRRQDKPSNRILSLFVALLLPLIVGGIGAVITGSSLGDWYPTLTKPSWNPPGWLFGPVWTSLYLLMGYASYRVFQLGWGRAEVRVALQFYGAQLIFNLGWSVLFFGLQRPDLALIEIIVLLALVIVTMIRFGLLDRIAGWLLLPYAAWTTFASLLNASIWWLNR